MPLTAAERAFAARGRVPLVVLLSALAGWWEDRHMELLAEAGFDDIRRAHNAVVVNLPATGRRLTELAEAAGMTKQAMAQLVDDLVATGYLARRPDPDDRRAKLIVWADRGMAAHEQTLEIFAEIDKELTRLIGRQPMAQMKDALMRLFFALVVAQEA